MRRKLTAGLIVFGLTVAHGISGMAAPAPVCVPIVPPDPRDPVKLQRCAIDTPADCDKINDYPYARDLFCAAAYAGAQTMVQEIATTLGVKAPTDGFFYFYQSLPDPVAQTTVSCMDTPAPYPGGSKDVTGAGTPLCDLVAYVTSPGPDAKKAKKGDPIPGTLRSFPDYFGKLYSPDKKFELTKFRTGSAFDDVVTGLGAAGYDGFTSDYKKFSTTKLYDPDHFAKDSRYGGMSGGGGGGWGGEIAILGPLGPVVQFAFGGGGGGGMNSSLVASPPPAPSAAPAPLAQSGLGAGGGGGAQFANGYRSAAGKPYNGLGLGAGVGSTDAHVQYSYNDYEGSGRPPQPDVHVYNAAIIGDYQTQLQSLADQLKSGYSGGKTIVVRGGGGMGAGTQYLASGARPLLPAALSTQGGFQFSYAFARKHPVANDSGMTALDNLNVEQQNIYEVIGEAYQTASQLAFEHCGSDYSKFACMCPIEHALVICMATEAVGGDPAKVPGWLQQRHCPGDDPAAGPGLRAFSGYQRYLLGAASAVSTACTAELTGFFKAQNTLVDGVQ